MEIEKSDHENEKSSQNSQKFDIEPENFQNPENPEKHVQKKPLKNFVKTLPFIDRYFTRLYSPSEHLYYFQHTNRMVLAGLSASHPLIAEKLKIDRIEFCFKNQLVSEKNGAENSQNFAKNEHEFSKKDAEIDFKNIVSGKKKRGGIVVQPNMKLCRLFAGERVFMVRSLVNGAIIEINRDLLEGDFGSLQRDSEGAGFLFIINLPSLNYKIYKENHEFLEIEKTIPIV